MYMWDVAFRTMADTKHAGPKAAGHVLLHAGLYSALSFG